MAKQDDRREEHQDVNVRPDTVNEEEEETSRVRPDTGDEDGTVGDQHTRSSDNH